MSRIDNVSQVVYCFSEKSPFLYIVCDACIVENGEYCLDVANVFL